jgi:hypothetical protein
MKGVCDMDKVLFTFGVVMEKEEAMQWLWVRMLGLDHVICGITPEEFREYCIKEDKEMVEYYRSNGLIHPFERRV